MRKIAAVAVAVVLFPGVAVAQDEGQSHLTRAEAALAAGEYVVAQNEYIAAYGELNDPRIFFYLAQAYELGGQPESAVIYYRRYLAQVEVPDQHREEVRAKIDALDPKPKPKSEPKPEPKPKPEPVVALPSPSQAPGAIAASTVAPVVYDEPPRLVTSTTRKKKKWYGYQIMLSDLATIALAVGTENGNVLVAGYLLGPTFVHGLNGEKGKAVGSPVLRAGLPVVGALIGVGVEDCNGGAYCGLGGILIGGGAGLLTAVIVDYSWSSKTVELPGFVAVNKCQGGADCTTYGWGMSF